MVKRRTHGGIRTVSRSVSTTWSTGQNGTNMSIGAEYSKKCRLPSWSVSDEAIVCEVKVTKTRREQSGSREETADTRASQGSNAHGPDRKNGGAPTVTVPILWAKGRDNAKLGALCSQQAQHSTNPRTPRLACENKLRSSQLAHMDLPTLLFLISLLFITLFLRLI